MNKKIEEMAYRFSNKKMPIVTLLEIISELQSKVDEIKVPNEKELVDEVMNNLHRLSKLKSFEAQIDLEPTKEELKGYTQEEIQKLKEYISSFFKELSTGNEEKLSLSTKELNDLLKNHTSKIYGDFGNISKKINDRLSELKDGVDGINGIDGKDGTDAEITAESVRDLLETLKGDERLDVSAIKGIEKLATKKDLDTMKPGLQGTNNGVTVRNIVAGNGITIDNTNPEFPKITSTATGGGFTTILSAETPNGTLTVFTFATATSKPSFIISDNAMMRDTTKLGTVNWTWNNTLKQATLSIPVNDDIVAIA